MLDVGSSHPNLQYNRNEEWTETLNIETQKKNINKKLPGFVFIAQNVFVHYLFIKDMMRK